MIHKQQHFQNNSQTGFISKHYFYKQGLHFISVCGFCSVTARCVPLAMFASSEDQGGENPHCVKQNNSTINDLRIGQTLSFSVSGITKHPSVSTWTKALHSNIGVQVELMICWTESKAHHSIKLHSIHNAHKTHCLQYTSNQYIYFLQVPSYLDI